MKMAKNFIILTILILLSSMTNSIKNKRLPWIENCGFHVWCANGVCKNDDNLHGAICPGWQDVNTRFYPSRQLLWCTNPRTGAQVI